MIAHPTASDIRMKEQVRDIYRALTSCGFPGLINKSVAKEEREIEELLSDYFQPTPNRETLIQWLIMQVFPLYQPQGSKIDKKGSKTKKILACLWRLGVLHYSKHTKNLDYQKYVLGLIGQQNAITLIFNLCTLLLQSKRAIKSRQDNQFHYFLQDIYKNYDSLINVDYDPYKVSFPPAYNQLSQQQFDQKYAVFLQKINKLKANPTIDQQSSNSELSFQRVFKQFQSNKQDFIKAYEDLAIKMRSTIEQHQGMIQPWKKDMNEQLKGRTLNISSHLPALYRKYKEKIKLNLIGSSKVGEQAADISKLITSINSQVQI